MDMNSASNYLIMYCIYECNNSLNDFMTIFKNKYFYIHNLRFK